MNYEYLTIEDAEKLAKKEISEQKAVEYLDSLGNKRMFMTMNEVDLINLVLKYKKQINEAIEVLKLCNSKCAKEVIDILRGENNEK